SKRLRRLPNLQNSKQRKTNGYIIQGEIIFNRKLQQFQGQSQKAETKKKDVEVKDMTFKDITVSTQKKRSLAWILHNDRQCYKNSNLVPWQKYYGVSPCQQ